MHWFWVLLIGIWIGFTLGTIYWLVFRAGQNPVMAITDTILIKINNKKKK